MTWTIPESTERDVKRRKRWPIIAALLGLNVVVVGGLGISRINAIRRSGEEFIPALATTVVLMAAAAGVPWCFEFVSRRFRPVKPLLYKRWNVRFALIGENRRRNKARKTMATAKQLSSAWTQEAARIRAIYTLAYRLSIAKLRGTAGR